MQHFSYLAEIFVVGGIVSALIIAADLHSCRQPMRIMNSVWILTGLWASVIGLWAYFTFGRAAAPEPPISAAGKRGRSRKQEQKHEPKRKREQERQKPGLTACGK